MREGTPARPCSPRSESPPPFLARGRGDPGSLVRAPLAGPQSGNRRFPASLAFRKVCCLVRRAAAARCTLLQVLRERDAGAPPICAQQKGKQLPRIAPADLESLFVLS